MELPALFKPEHSHSQALVLFESYLCYRTLLDVLSLRNSRWEHLVKRKQNKLLILHCDNNNINCIGAPTSCFEVHMYKNYKPMRINTSFNIPLSPFLCFWVL